MKTAIIAGASGLTGSFLLQLLLNSDRYSEVKALVRRPLAIEHPILKQVTWDFENPNPEEIRADHVYCSLGTTMKKAGSKEKFRKVDYEYPLQLARMAYDRGTKKIALVSAVGANSKSMFFYNKVKGKLEEDLKKIPFEAIYIFRPSMLLGSRQEFRLGEEAGKAVMKTFSFILPDNLKPIHVSQVAGSMLDYMNREEKGVQLIQSGQMLKYSTTSTSE